jgi:hypothetical protein
VWSPDEERTRKLLVRDRLVAFLFFLQLFDWLRARRHGGRHCWENTASDCHSGVVHRRRRRGQTFFGGWGVSGPKSPATQPAKLLARGRESRKGSPLPPPGSLPWRGLELPERPAPGRNVL